MLKFNRHVNRVFFVHLGQITINKEKYIFELMADYIDNNISNDDGSGYMQYSGNEDQNIPLIKDVSDSSNLITSYTDKCKHLKVVFVLMLEIRVLYVCLALFL